MTRKARTQTGPNRRNSKPKARRGRRGRGKLDLAGRDGSAAEAGHAGDLRRGRRGAQEDRTRLQDQRITALVKGAELPRATERRYEKCKDEIIELLKQVRFNNTRIEHLVEQLYELNRRLVTEEGRLLRAGRKRRGQARRFSAALHGQRAGGRLAGARRGAARPRLGPPCGALRRGREAPRRDRADRDGSKAADRRVPPRRADRAARRARGEPRQEGDGRGQSAARHLDREEIHQPRPAIPRSDPGRQYRADEGGR